MSDGYNDAAIICYAEALVERARDDADFAAGVLFAAAQMLAATGNRAQISRSIKDFTAEVWGAAADTITGTSAADALLARIGRTEGDADV